MELSKEDDFNTALTQLQTTLQLLLVDGQRCADQAEGIFSNSIDYHRIEIQMSRLAFLISFEDEYRKALKVNDAFEWAHSGIGLILMHVRRDYDAAERAFRVSQT